MSDTSPGHAEAEPPADDRRPVGEVLADLAIDPLAEGASAVEAFVLIKVRYEDGEDSWCYRTTREPNREELLGALTVQIDLLRKELLDDWST
ncbi:MAG: hypothetical protein ACRDY0_09515 [Acidimicrobiales bacterium]